MEGCLRIDIRDILQCCLISAYHIVSSSTQSAYCGTGLQRSHSRLEIIYYSVCRKILRCYTDLLLRSDTQLHGVLISGIRHLTGLCIPEIFHLGRTYHIRVVPEGITGTVLSHTVCCHQTEALLTIGKLPTVYGYICGQRKVLCLRINGGIVECHTIGGVRYQLTLAVHTPYFQILCIIASAEAVVLAAF